MRKVYVLEGWTPTDGMYISGIYTSRKKAERIKKILEESRKGSRIYNIETEVLL